VPARIVKRKIEQAKTIDEGQSFFFLNHRWRPQDSNPFITDNTSKDTSFMVKRHSLRI